MSIYCQISAGEIAQGRSINCQGAIVLEVRIERDSNRVFISGGGIDIRERQVLEKSESPISE